MPISMVLGGSRSEFVKRECAKIFWERWKTEYAVEELEMAEGGTTKHRNENNTRFITSPNFS